MCIDLLATKLVDLVALEDRQFEIKLEFER